MQVRQAGYLLDILRSAEAIQNYIEGFSREAVARLTPLTKERFEKIPFHKMTGLKNRVVHDYGQINFEIVWETVDLHLSQVRNELRAFFSNDEDTQT